MGMSEKEAKFGGCVLAKNSYCFAYAACESVIGDFMITNANAALAKGLLPGQGRCGEEDWGRD
jgi:hypothetical protein